MNLRHEELAVDMLARCVDIMNVVIFITVTLSCILKARDTKCLLHHKAII